MTTPVTPADRDLFASLKAGLLQLDMPILLPPDFTGPVGPGQLVQSIEPAENQHSVESASSGDDSDTPDERPWRRGRFEVSPPETAARGLVRIVGRRWLSKGVDPQAAEALHVKLRAAGPEACRLIQASLEVAGRAGKGDPVAMRRMTEWFGPRPAVVAAGEDWWLGVLLILRQIKHYLVHPVYLYYGGPETMSYTPEYPRAGVVSIQEMDEDDDVNVVASCTSNARDLVVVLRRYACSQTELKVPVKGFHSIASTLVHELTHNLCGTEDHKLPKGGGVVSSVRQALTYARYVPSKAWYNAYNLEFFCEDAANGELTAAERDSALELIEAAHKRMLTEQQ